MKTNIDAVRARVYEDLERSSQPFRAMMMAINAENNMAKIVRLEKLQSYITYKIIQKRNPIDIDVDELVAQARKGACNYIGSVHIDPVDPDLDKAIGQALGRGKA
jgi:hypothetical protein